MLAVVSGCKRAQLVVLYSTVLHRNFPTHVRDTNKPHIFKIAIMNFFKSRPNRFRENQEKSKN